MGVTVLYSSGDYGVAGNGGFCLNPDGACANLTVYFYGLLPNMTLLTYTTGTRSPEVTIFNPAFPSTCPYITSVGATQVNPGSKVTDPEGACEQVSFFFVTPSFRTKPEQHDIVGYLQRRRILELLRHA